MSNIRHIDEHEIVVRSLGLGLPSGSVTGGHCHPWAQLIYATSGVLTVSTPSGLWVVPSRRAVWMPPGLTHDVEATGEVSMQTLYFRPDTISHLPQACRVMPVSPLLRELVLEARRHGFLIESDAAQGRLAAVIVDQMASMREAPLDLRMPADPRARRVADRIRADPASTVPLRAFAQGSGASPRTIERLFERETGHTFGRWRQRARLLEALRLLALGESVTSVSFSVGYDSPSAFIAMFKSVLGTTPRRWASSGATDMTVAAHRA